MFVLVNYIVLCKLTLIIEKPASYSDYENYTFTYGNSSKYEYLEEIGFGAYCVVYKARNIETNEFVVIKVLKPI